jgi:methionyl-tRNA synthetase
MVAKNLDGKMPLLGEMSEADRVMLGDAYGLPAKARAAMKDFALHTMLSDIWRVVADANRYFASEEPWAKRKNDPERFETVLAVTLEVLRIVGIMVQPVMPEAAAKLLDVVGSAVDARQFSDAVATAAVVQGTVLPSPSPIFPRYVETEGDATN